MGTELFSHLLKVYIVKELKLAAYLHMASAGFSPPSAYITLRHFFKKSFGILSFLPPPLIDR